jgi:hypothetical protein
MFWRIFPSFSQKIIIPWSRKQIPGFMKDETPQSTILECVTPKSKCYALRVVTDATGEIKIDKKCKGTAKTRVKRLQLKSYRQCIETKAVIKASMTRIQSKDHHLQTILQNRVCLSSFDDKRFLLNCGKHSKPYGTVNRDPNCARCENII